MADKQSISKIIACLNEFYVKQDTTTDFYYNNTLYLVNSGTDLSTELMKPTVTEYFSGDGNTTVFPLSSQPVNTQISKYVKVLSEGYTPTSIAYLILDNAIQIEPAPPEGIDNIRVSYIIQLDEPISRVSSYTDAYVGSHKLTDICIVNEEPSSSDYPDNRVYLLPQSENEIIIGYNIYIKYNNEVIDISDNRITTPSTIEETSEELTDETLLRITAHYLSGNTNQVVLLDILCAEMVAETPPVISTLSSGSKIYMEETVDGITSNVPYIYLGLDESGNCRLLREDSTYKDIATSRYAGMEWDGSNLGYNQSQADIWLSNGYLSRFSEEIISYLISTSIKYKYNDTIRTISRRCFLLGYDEVGGTGYNDGISYLGALKTYYNTEIDRLARICKGIFSEKITRSSTSTEVFSYQLTRVYSQDNSLTVIYTPSGESPQILIEGIDYTYSTVDNQTIVRISKTLLSGSTVNYQYNYNYPVWWLRSCDGYSVESIDNNGSFQSTSDDYYYQVRPALSFSAQTPYKTITVEGEQRIIISSEGNYKPVIPERVRNATYNKLRNELANVDGHQVMRWRRI